ncbi:MAG: hypothetical protein JNL72_02020 [Flavipsychrobacter sp.]|nr:hypothetical protein [Flavipsychrobacter sp.]
MSKKNIVFIVVLAALAALAGYLISEMPWYGRWGMSIFYKEYNFLKVWWKGAAVIYTVWLLIFAGHAIVKAKTSKASALAANLISMIFSIGGLYFTYMDFQHDTTHHIMGENFHVGFYLFWLGWMGISLYFLGQKSSRQLIVSGKTA